MKDMKRALRRHHRQRLIARALRSYVLRGNGEEDRLHVARRWFNNMQRCSCYMCGHRRKWHGPTTQERRLSQVDPDDNETYISRGPAEGTR